MDSDKKTARKFLGLTSTYWLIIGSVVALLVVSYAYTVMRSPSGNASSSALIAKDTLPKTEIKRTALQPGASALPANRRPTNPSTNSPNAYLANLQQNSQASPAPDNTQSPSENNLAPAIPPLQPVTDTGAHSYNHFPAPGDTAAVQQSATPMNSDQTQSAATVNLGSKIQEETGRLIQSQSQQIQTLTGTIETLRAQVSDLNSKLDSTKQQADTIKDLHKQNARLEHLLYVERHKTTVLGGTLAKRPVLPGWTVAAINDNAAVLSGPGGAIKLVHKGDDVFGLTILAINGDKGTVVTSAGTLTGN